LALLRRHSASGHRSSGFNTSILVLVFGIMGGIHPYSTAFQVVMPRFFMKILILVFQYALFALSSYSGQVADPPFFTGPNMHQPLRSHLLN
jgi:hypothetical protein